MKLSGFKNWIKEDASIPLSKDMSQQPVPGIEGDNSDFLAAGCKSKYKPMPKPLESRIDPEKKYKGWSKKTSNIN